MRSYRILLIGNYLPDQQQSMIRMAVLLKNIYSSNYLVRVISPPCVFGALSLLPLNLRKYLSYIDKLVIFPFVIAFWSCFYDLVHIVDHGNSYYSFFVFHNRCIVSCHDLLAIRGAIGDLSVACSPSPLGPFLQSMIKFGLKRAKAIAFVSNSTYLDFRRLIGNNHSQLHSVILNPLNNLFFNSLDDFKISKDELKLVPPSPFLLMVGNSHPRKNRILGIKLVNALNKKYSYNLVLAGKSLSTSETQLINRLKVNDYIYFIQTPSDSLLNYLYCSAHALIFPSVAEGFGWPLIEAQACSCPVIASDNTSIPEVAGLGALYAKYDDVNLFLEHVIALNDDETRRQLILEGYNNLSRFNFDLVRQSYLSLASAVISNSR